MQFSRGKSLKPYNTFGVDVKADRFVSVTSVDELKEVLQQTYASELFLLGGGSNMLLTQDLDKTVVHLNLLGKKIVKETDEEVWVEAMAGENWHTFVLYCLENGFGGLENLSLIPGNVGTTPVQNIGAYGVEIKDHFDSCRVLNIQTLQESIFSLEDCKFGYRDSIFKNALKDQVVILSVTFRLTRKNHKLNTSYGSIDKYLEQKGVLYPGIKEVSDAVIEIRRSKLPDPKVLGNSGSFFKNPVISKEKLHSLQEEFPEIPFYPLSENQVKVPAGWLIERAGLKGYREGDAGVHQNQALVLVNYGQASGSEILSLAKRVQEKVDHLFGIKLQPEVNIF